MDVRGWDLLLSSGESNEWEHVDDNPGLSVSSGRVSAADTLHVPSHLTTSEAIVRPLSSSDLSWTDSHFEDPERMFKSLEFDRSEVLGESYEEPRHRSLNDMLDKRSRVTKPHTQTSHTMPNVRNGNVNTNYEEDEDSDDDIESMKNMLLSAWTNAKNGWIVKTSTSFKHETPIWLLGRRYICTKSDTGSKKKEKDDKILNSFDEFKLDFRSRIWLTYRTDLPTLPGSHLKSDVGWGCMLRCGQMLLAQAFVLHFLNRDWRWESDKDEYWHQEIVRYFGDTEKHVSPFSIQKLVSIGLESGRKAGDWYGPASIAFALRSALSVHQQQQATEKKDGNTDDPLSLLSIYVARDGVVYVQDILDESCGNTASCESTDVTREQQQHQQQQQQQHQQQQQQQIAHRGTISPPDCTASPQIGLPSRSSDLPSPGCDAIPQQCYGLPPPRSLTLPQQCDVLTSPQDMPRDCDKLPVLTGDTLSQWRSVVVIIPMRLGGESINLNYVPYIKTLLNFEQCVGIIGGKPKHSLYFIGWQDEKLIYLDPHCCQDFIDVSKHAFNLQTFHCQSPRKLSFSKMDPSCAIAFYCRRRSDLDALLKEIEKIVSPPIEQHYPMFHIEKGRQVDVEMSCKVTETRSVRTTLVSKRGRDDFMLL